jgi:hypothetical protein
MLALDPDRAQVARIGRAIEREGRPFAVEWIELLRARPLAHGGLALAAACLLLATTPLGSLLWALLREARS